MASFRLMLGLPAIFVRQVLRVLWLPFLTKPNSLINNQQEVVIVADEEDVLVGFVCVQLKKSFCYDEYMPEITEVYVSPTYRKKGIASEMITFAENYCTHNYSLHKYELLTGRKNIIAQSVYGKLGYTDDNELHLSKRIKK